MKNFIVWANEMLKKKAEWNNWVSRIILSKFFLGYSILLSWGFFNSEILWFIRYHECIVWFKKNFVAFSKAKSNDSIHVNLILSYCKRLTVWNMHFEDNRQFEIGEIRKKRTNIFFSKLFPFSMTSNIMDDWNWMFFSRRLPFFVPIHEFQCKMLSIRLKLIHIFIRKYFSHICFI